MALTVRKKKGLTTALSGAAGLAVGVILFVTTSTPDWVPLAIQVVSAVASAVGFAIVFPDHE